MGWDEQLFGGLYRLARRLRPAARPGGEGVALASLRERLGILAGVLHGGPLVLLGADGVGGVRQGRLCLPEEIVLETVEQGVDLYVYRVALEELRLRRCVALPEGAAGAGAAGAGARLLWTLRSLPQSWQALEEELPGCAALRVRLAEAVLRRRLPATTPLAAALEAQVRRTLRGEPVEEAVTWEVLRRLPGEAPAAVELWGELGELSDVRAVVGAPQPAAEGSCPEGDLPGGTERQGRNKERVREVRMREDRQDENPLTHVFEKVRTAEEYRGGRKPTDGEDELDEHLAALDELDLREVIRGHGKVRSVYRAELPLLREAPDLVEGDRAEAPFLYDEWDEGARRYRKDHCQVYVGPPPVRVGAGEVRAYVRDALLRQTRQVRALHLLLARLARERRWRSRCADGPEVDIDALVDRHGALRSGHSPPHKLYLSRRPHHPDLAALVLIDSSLSTDSWVGGRRVLDVARESVMALGEVLCGGGAGIGQIGIGAFHSHTRRACRYLVIKGFADPWTVGQERLAQLAPAGYTRIGPALRHATALLQAVPARRRLLLLLSDGKPTDYDRYEGAYGMADVRQALREAQRAHVQPFALAIDAQARSYLPAIFGAGSYEILPDAGRLTDALMRLFSRLLR